MTDAISSFGTLLKVGDGAGGGEAFATVAEVKDIKGPKIELGREDATSHSSPNGWKEKVATLLDAGEVSFDINFIPTHATHSHATGLLRDQVNRTKRNFQLVFPDTTTWAFTAYVANFEPDMPVEGVLTAAITLDITGQPTLA